MMDRFAQALCQKMESYREEMLFHFKELLKIGSVRGERLPGAPFGEENRKALDYILRLSREFGLVTVDMDGYIGYSEYGEGGQYVCCIGHLDVVPPGGGWTWPPFAAEERDGVIYARGAGDDKPGCVAGLYALRCMKELGYAPRRRIRVIYGCAEETGMEDLDYYLRREPLPAFGFTPDSDNYDIVNAEKGRMEFRLAAKRPAGAPVAAVSGGLASNMVPAAVTAVFDTARMTEEECGRLRGCASAGVTLREEAGAAEVSFRGVSAHAAMPETGRSAVCMYAHLACRVLGEGAGALERFIEERIGFDWNVPGLGIACRDDLMGPLTLNLGLIGTEGDEEFVVGDIRYPSSTNAGEITAGLAKAADEAGLRLEILSAVDGHHCTCEEEFAILREVCLDKGKPEPRCRAIAGGTYAKKFGGRLVAFGGCGDSVHAPDEFVPVRDFYDHTDMVAYALYRLSKR